MNCPLCSTGTVVCDAHRQGYERMLELQRETKGGPWLAPVLLLILVIGVPLGVLLLLAIIRLFVGAAWGIIGS